MKYLIEGKPFKSLKQIREELTFLKYKEKEGALLNWLDSETVLSIFRHFLAPGKLDGFSVVYVMRRTLGGRVLVAYNPTLSQDLILSVRNAIKKGNDRLQNRAS